MISTFSLLFSPSHCSNFRQFFLNLGRFIHFKFADFPYTFHLTTHYNLVYCIGRMYGKGCGVDPPSSKHKLIFDFPGLVVPHTHTAFPPPPPPQPHLALAPPHLATADVCCCCCCARQMWWWRYMWRWAEGLTGVYTSMGWVREDLTVCV